MAHGFSKFGYLNYEEIFTKISEKLLDAFDVVYTKDTHLCYLISPDLEPVEIKSKVYTYKSVEQAEIALNNNTDTYEGQIVSILQENVYVGYIVNQHPSGNYYVTSLSEFKGDIDYNSLGNKPIINMVGTLDNPIVINNLESGTYMIKGQYTITPINTTFLSASNVLFLVDKSDECIYIKKITSKTIINYTIDNDENVTVNEYATIQYLTEQGYATTDYIDTKIATLDFVTRQEVQLYIQESVSDTLDTVIDEKIDIKLSEKEIDNANVLALFN